MLDSLTKKKIDDARDILVGKVPVPQAQVEQITIALIYKFMYDMDNEAISLGGNPKYFTGDYAQYAWNKLLDKRLSGEGRVLLYQNALTEIPKNGSIPQLFRDIFKNAFLPYRDPETLYLFLKCIDEFTYDHSERLGDAFEYLLAILGSQGDAGQFRTPRHIIDFIVALVDPQKEDVLLDPACGTAGFLISGYKHILKNNSSNYDPAIDRHTFEESGIPLSEVIVNGKKFRGDKLSPDQMAFLHSNIKGYDISFDMVRLSLVNMYLHGFSTPQIYEYDTLTYDTRWGEHANVILANPPFMTPKGGIKPHTRFSIQAKRSEVLFVDYIMEHLTANGRAGIIVPEGIIFKSDTATKQLRKTLVESNYLVGVISLPAGVFNPYSGVKTSILWIDKSLAKKTDKIIFLKVNSDGYDLGAQRRPIDRNDLPAVYAHAMAYKEAVLTGNEFRIPGKDIILVEKTKLAESGDYNLSGERYLVKLKTQSQYPIVELKDFVKIKNGFAFDSAKYVDNGIRVIRITNVQKGIIVDDNPKYYPHDSEKELQNYLLGANEILVSLTGNVGRVGRITSELLPAFLNQRVCSIVSINDKLEENYLFWMLNNPRFESYATDESSGIAQKNLSTKAIERYQIPLPPLSVQEEIVTELDSYQKIIDGAKQVVDNWKPRIDINPDWPQYKCQEIVTSITAPKKIQTSEYKNSGLYPVIDQSMKDIGGWTDDEKAVIKVEAPIVVFGDHTCRLKYIDRDFCQGADGIKILKTSEGVNPKYFYYCILAYPVIPQGYNRHFSRLMEKEIWLPELAVQDKIVRDIESEETIIDALRRIINTYEATIDYRMKLLWRSE